MDTHTNESRQVSLGRTVLYVEGREALREHRGAVKTAVVSYLADNGSVTLHVYEIGQNIVPVTVALRVPFDANRTPGTWHWPAKV